MLVTEVSLDFDGMLRYYLHTIKKGNINARQEWVHCHFQCRSLTRRMLIGHVAIQLMYHADGKKRRQFFPEDVNYAAALTSVLNGLLGTTGANRSDFRQAIISFLNVMFPAFAKPAPRDGVVSDTRLSEKSGHTQGTAQVHYHTGVADMDTDRELARAVHSALGYSEHAPDENDIAETEGVSCAAIGEGSSYNNLAGVGECELAILWFHRLITFGTRE